MKDKLKEFVDNIFEDAPRSRECDEMKEEILANTYERYDDLIREGKSPAAAYNGAVMSIGDVSAIVDKLKKAEDKAEEGPKEDKTDTEEIVREIASEMPSVTLTEEQQRIAESYYFKSGIMKTVAIILYMLCWVPLVLISSLSLFGAASDAIGITLLMLFVAAATALMILRGVIAPAFLRSSDKKKRTAEDEEKEEEMKDPLMRLISGIVWGAVFALYFIISFASGKWGVTWILFIIGGALENVCEAVVEYIRTRR